MHAIIRQKTLLGETYVQLIPESHTGPTWLTTGACPSSQVEPSVTLDDVLNTFDPKTRAAFKIWQQAAAEGIHGRGEQINADFASLEPFAEHANKLVGILATQEGAVRALVHNTGVVFNALASRDHQLEGLIVNGEHTFHAASEASQAFADAFRVLPAFERNSRKALKELDALRRRRQPVPRRIPDAGAQAVRAARGDEAVRAAVRPAAHVPRSADEGRQDGSARPRQVAEADRTDARKPAAGAAQPRSVPAVHAAPISARCRRSSRT